MSRRGFSQFFKVLLLVFIVASIATYYIGLEQYPTNDQSETLGRFNQFLSYLLMKGPSYDLRNCSHVGYVLVGLPGAALKLLSKEWAAKFAPHLPYLIVQVTIALLLIILAYRILRRLLEVDFNRNPVLYLCGLLLLLNVPWLKALCKVLKHDCLSILFSTLLLLYYSEWMIRGRRRSLVISSLCGVLAFYEKDVAILSLIFIVGFEFLRNLFDGELPLRRLVLRSLVQIGQIIFFLLVLPFLFIPLAWRNPSVPFDYLSQLGPYAESLSIIHVVVFGIVVVALLLLRAPISRITNRLSADTFALGTSVVVAVTAIGATTLDSSGWVTRAKMTLDGFQLLIYSAPEIVTILLLLPLFRRRYFTRLPGAFGQLGLLFATFIIAKITLYGVFISPLEAKYLTVVFVAETLLAILFLFRFAPAVEEMKVTTVMALILFLGLMVRPITANCPSYLGFLSWATSRTVENQDHQPCMSKIGMASSTPVCSKSTTSSALRLNSETFSHSLPA